MSVLPLLAAAALVGATAWMLARRLSLATTGVLLAAYALAFAEIVIVCLGLSTLRSLGTTQLFVSTVGVFVAVAFITLRLGRPPAELPGITALRVVARDPLLVTLGIVVASTLAYSAALVIFTPPNDWDAMMYQLPRAAFWIQQHGVGYVPNSPELRINGNPPNSEIAMLFTMALSDGDRFVGAVQVSALLASAVGVYGVARRIGLDSRAAAFGGLLFVTLPVVVLQSSAALNDLVVASLLITATYFLLGETKPELALGGLALALALGTKFTAYLALPLLAAVLALAHPTRRWGRIGIALVAAIGIGSYWLLVNLAHTGSVDGGISEEYDQRPDRDPVATLGRAVRLAIGFLDTMNPGQDIYVYALTAAAFVALAFALDRGRTRRALPFACAVAAAGCAPLLLPGIRDNVLRAHEKLWTAVGRDDLALLDPTRDPWSPSTTHSYFGPLGVLLLTSAVPLSIRALRARTIRTYVALLVAAPWLFAVVLAASVVYDPLRGRFFMFPVAIAAATWGLALRHRWLAWASVSIATATVALTFVHSIQKPAGVELFKPEGRGVWGEERLVTQTRLRPDGTADVVRFLDEERQDGLVALRVGSNDWTYLFFGRHLDREVEFVGEKPPPVDADWVVSSPQRPGSPGSGWSMAFETRDGWRVHKR